MQLGYKLCAQHAHSTKGGLVGKGWLVAYSSLPPLFVLRCSGRTRHLGSCWDFPTHTHALHAWLCLIPSGGEVLHHSHKGKPIPNSAPLFGTAVQLILMCVALAVVSSISPLCAPWTPKGNVILPHLQYGVSLAYFLPTLAP